MSNWAKAKVTFKNMSEELLMDTLKAMGMYADFNNKTVKGSFSFEGDRTCDCVLYRIADDSCTNIGLSFAESKDNGVSVSVVADWFDKEYTDKTFVEEFQMEYSTAAMNKNAFENGYTIEQAENLSNGKRRIVYVKTA